MTGKPADDVWGDSDDDFGEHGRDSAAVTKDELDREWSNRRQQFITAGYRDGLDEGKALTLQKGFDHGFREGAAAGYGWGVARGAVKTLEVFQARLAAAGKAVDQQVLAELSISIPAIEARLSTFSQLLSRPVPKVDSNADTNVVSNDGGRAELADQVDEPTTPPSSTAVTAAIATATASAGDPPLLPPPAKHDMARIVGNLRTTLSGLGIAWPNPAHMAAAPAQQSAGQMMKASTAAEDGSGAQGAVGKEAGQVQESVGRLNVNDW